MKIQIPDVTLLAVSSIEIPETIASLQKSCEKINFGSVKLISHEKPHNLPETILFEKCSKINNIMDFNYYAFYYLTNHIKTSHCLLVHADSWIIHPEMWDDEWLKWDYIGAPWPWKNDAYISHDTGEHVQVGNGGFSLRSKKILDIPSQYKLPLLQEQGFYNEDGNLAVYHRSKMLSLGVKYAPLAVASKFSYENSIPENEGMQTFGFHKNMNPWG